MAVIPQENASARSARSDKASEIAAVVLAAGWSSRMGAFKPLLPFGRGTVVDHVVAVLREAGVELIHVVYGHRADEMVPKLASLDVTRTPSLQLCWSD